MAYRYGDRKQNTLFPQSIDEYIPQDAPVRAYDVFVDSLEFAELGIEIEPHKVGCPQYDPKSCSNCCSMDIPMEFVAAVSWKERLVTIFRLFGLQAD